MNSSYPILLVDDEDLPRKIIKKNLTKAGFKVETAKNGYEALEKLAVQFYPIVITDWLMPEMNGIELCKTIRETNYQGYIYLIILTIKDTKESIITGLNTGADDFLNKPVSNDELLARLNTAVRILNLERSLKKANDEIRRLSISDPLTKCYNRGFLIERLPQEIKRALRYNHTLSLLLSDIDDFKLINDNFGHHIGDETLKEYVKRVDNIVRKNIDWTARYGGEEFITILPETKSDGALIVAERIRQSISNHAIKIGKNKIKITISTGVAICDPSFNESKTMTSEDLIKKADRLMYQAKKEGKNKVVPG